VSVVADELRRLEEDRCMAETMWRPIQRAIAHAVGYEADASLAAELVFERAREYASRAVPGLVSDPTSGTRSVNRVRSAALVKSMGLELREHLRLCDPSTDAGRIAKLRRSVGVTARMHNVSDAVAPGDRCVMVTLTYAGTNADWKPDHVSSFIRHVRQWLNRRDVRFRYVWVAELQKRGVIHYHVAIWLPAGIDLPKPDNCGWWPHGMTRIETARAAVPYLMKYLSKGGTADRYRLPRSARSYGGGGLEATMRLARRWLGLPSFVRARADVEQSEGWKRAPGGGWVDPDGQIWASEFARVFAGDRWALEKVLDHGRPFEADGPFSWLTQ
jgi:hypothetical protein